MSVAAVADSVVGKMHWSSQFLVEHGEGVDGKFPGVSVYRGFNNAKYQVWLVWNVILV